MPSSPTYRFMGFSLLGSGLVLLMLASSTGQAGKNPQPSTRDGGTMPTPPPAPPPSSPPDGGTMPTPPPASPKAPLTPNDFLSYSPTSVRGGGSFTFHGVVNGRPIDVRMDDRPGSKTNGVFYVIVESPVERPLTKAELTAWSAGIKKRGDKSPAALDTLKAIANALVKIR